MTLRIALFFLTISGVVASNMTSSMARAAPTVPVTIQGNTIPKRTKQIIFTVPADHHFNKEAPNRIEMIVDGTWTKANSLKLQKDHLEADWDKEGVPCSGLRTVLYVCDDANTYCIPHGQSFQCDGDRWTAKEWNPTNLEASNELPKADEELFIDNDTEKALKAARETNHPILIDFYGIWCPPCNQLDETVFSSRPFDQIKDKFVLLKLDADAPASWDLKSKYKIGGYPTVVFTNSHGEEISRIVGARPVDYFIAEMNRVLKNKEDSLEKKKELADTKDGSTAAYEVGLVYLDRGDFSQAQYYLSVASRSWTLGDIRRNKLLSADLGLQSHSDDKKTYLKFLLKSLEWYPHQPEVFDRASDLAKVAEDLEDKEAEKKAYNTEIETAQWYLDHPKAARLTDSSRGDLFELMGDAHESLMPAPNEQQLSEASYGKAADAYLADINRAKLDPEKERGFNLERLYCLWKSGKRDEAKKLYDNMENLYPTEFTFFYQHGRLLNDAKDYKQAEEKALKAYEFSYGDNRLRAADLLAQVYKNEAQPKKALEVLNKTLEKATLPDDKSIRTHRYYDKLVQLKNKLK